ncbi:MAG: pseudouridine synthase [Eubacterium sp.]
MRINKYIAEAGIASRRKADELIRQGKVKVNGAILTHPGYDVQDSDEVIVCGQPVRHTEQAKVYYMLNKPTGCITSVHDDKGRPTVMDLMQEVQERIYPVGRLDFQTSGLLFLTNDGDFAYRLTHPKHEVGKTYVLRAEGSLSRRQLNLLRNGVNIGGFKTSPARVRVLKCNKHSTVLEMTIHEGKNRQIRRMLEAVGSHVLELERVAYGNIVLGHLKPGRFRRLSPSEVAYLMQKA